MAEKDIGGRPTIYSDAIADIICEQIALGRTMVEICTDPALPAKSTVFKWLSEKDKKRFSDSYSLAHRIHLEVEADELKFIADNVPAVQGEVAKATLQIKTRMWRLSKLNPSKFGDKVEADATTAPEVEDVSMLTDEEKYQLILLKRKMNGTVN